MSRFYFVLEASDFESPVFMSPSWNDKDMSVLTLEQQDARHKAKGPLRVENPALDVYNDLV